MAEWRWADPSGQQRLIHTDELKAALEQGTVPTNALVWRRGWREWKHANDVSELFAKPGDGTPPPPDFMIDVQDQYEGKAPEGPTEPPPPPRYVPVIKKPEPKPATPPPPKAATPPPPKAVTPPPPKAAPPKAERPLPEPSVSKTMAPPPGMATPPQAPMQPARRPAPPPVPKKESAPPPKVEERRPAHATVVGVPVIDPALRVASPPPPIAKETPPAASMKRPTLLDPLSAPPSTSEVPVASSSPPIVAPAAKPVQQTSAVTQPPPFDGTARIADIPKMPPPSIPKVAQPVEELSGSVLLDAPESSRARAVELSSSDLSESEASAVVKAPPLGAVKQTSTLLGIAPSPVPIVKEEPEEPIREEEEEEREPPPRDAPSGVGIWDLRELRKKIVGLPRNQLIAGAVVGGALLIGLVALFVHAVSGGETSPIASTSASVPPIVTSAPPVVSTSPTPPPPTKLTSCTVSGDAHVVSPRALVGAGIEVVALEGSIALGFASAPKEGMITQIDPATMGATSVKRFKTTDNVKRVTPSDASNAILDVDIKGDAIKGRRTVGSFDLGGAGNDFVWAKDGSDETHKLWPLESDGAVEAIRGTSTKDGYAVAYRHAGSVWIGAMKKSDGLEPIGSPSHTQGLGPQVGSPAIASSDGTTLVVWADRAATSDPWGLRIVTWHPPDAPKSAIGFQLPAGGLGEHAMSPGVAALAGGTFLLVWTEGPVSNHQVRAQVLLADGTPSNSALAVSAEGVNAGQGQAAVLPDGRGVVAFLAMTGKNQFEVRATPIRCK